MDSNDLGLGLKECVKIKTKYFLYFKKPLDVWDNLIIWCECCEKENSGYDRVPLLYRIYHKMIKEGLKDHLDREGFLLESISINEWTDGGILEKKCIKLILNMNKLRQTLTIATRKTASCYSVQYKGNKFRLCFIGFIKKKNHKKIRTKKFDFNYFFNKAFPEEQKQIQNPFSRQFSLKFKRKIFIRDSYTCKYCGWKNGVVNKKDRVLTLDHIIPVAHGGTSKEENLTTCCLKCNIKKNDKILGFLIENQLKDKQINNNLNLEQTPNV